MILLNHLSWYLLIDGETVVIEEDEVVMDVLHTLIVKECAILKRTTSLYTTSLY